MTRLAWTILFATSAACGTHPEAKDPMQDPPIGFTFEATEGGFASFGWSGQLHGLTGALGTPFGVKATRCDDSGTCRFEGPSAPASVVDRRRCLLRTSQTCQADADCPRDGDRATPCVYIYDAPIATPLVGSDGKVGACGWSYIPITAADGKPSITGTLDLVSGDLNLERIAILLPLNGMVGGFRGVCPECVGDTAPNDGKKDGRCQISTHVDGARGRADPGLDLGGACDVHRYGTIPGYDGAYSMDCSATLTAGLGQPTQFGGAFTSAGFKIAVTAQSPDCTAGGFAGQKCFCGMCADGITACMSSADCGGGACGVPDTEIACDPNPYPSEANYDATLQVNQCKSFPADPTKFAVGGNACAGGTCDWDADRAVGTCTSKLTGKPIGCYPSGPGAQIVARGRALREDHLNTVYYADTASARCTPLGKSAALNSQLGLPGLTFQRRNFRIIPAYAEDR